MKVYAGIDLHSSNNYIGIINEKDERLYQKRLPNQLEYVLSALEPFKKDLEGVGLNRHTIGIGLWMVFRKRAIKFTWLTHPLCNNMMV